MAKFTKGDSVKFKTRYGNTVVGEFVGEEIHETIDGPTEVYIVLANPFENGKEQVRCMVGKKSLKAALPTAPSEA